MVGIDQYEKKDFDRKGGLRAVARVGHKQWASWGHSRWQRIGKKESRMKRTEGTFGAATNRCSIFDNSGTCVFFKAQ